MRIIGVIGGLACAFWSFWGCGSGYTPTTVDGFTQGTTFHIVIRDDIPAHVDIRRDIDSIFRRAEASMSLFDPNSLLCRLNRNETDSLDSYIADCIRIAGQVYRQSGGLFDITVKPLTSAYGFTGDGRRIEPNVDSLLQLVGYDKIAVEGGRLVKSDARVQIDLNGIAQGYTVDVMAGHFDRLGLENYLVEMGGEIFSRGLNVRNEPWVVGIDRPEEGSLVKGRNIEAKIRLSGRGLATSGNYRKFYDDESGRRIVHTINPLTGLPQTSDVVSVTVAAPSAALADAYGTFFLAAGRRACLDFLREHPQLDAVIIWPEPDGSLKTYLSEGLKIDE